jgi:hypothetical protein
MENDHLKKYGSTLEVIREGGVSRWPDPLDPLPGPSTAEQASEVIELYQFIRHNVECPNCFQLVPSDNIAIHADLCVAVWVGEVQSAEEDSEKKEELETSTDNDKLDIDQGINIKEIISNLVEQNVNKIDPRRINVRRKSLWADFKDARTRWNLKPSDPIRIVFLGEPQFMTGDQNENFSQVCL